MSKKVWMGGCLGCLLVIMLVGGIFGALAYWGISKAQGLVKGFEDAAASVQKLRTDFPYTPEPVDAPLDEFRLQAYLDARASLEGVLAKHATLNSLFTAMRTGTQPNISGMQVFSLFGEMPKAMEDAANALRAEGMSFHEFSHYSHLMLLTVKAGADEGDTRMVALWDQITTSADTIDTALAQNNNNPNQAKIEIEPLLEALDASELPEETKLAIRARLEAMKDDPALFILEAFILQMTQNTP